MDQTTARRWHEVRGERCEATRTIRLRYRIEPAVGYVVGKQLLALAAAAGAHPGFARTLPRLAAKLRQMFAPEEREEGSRPLGANITTGPIDRG